MIYPIIPIYLFRNNSATYAESFMDQPTQPKGPHLVAPPCPVGLHSLGSLAPHSTSFHGDWKVFGHICGDIP